MSAGTPVSTVRIPEPLKARVLAYLSERDAVACCVPWTFSDFVVVALLDKLSHIDRSRAKHRRRHQELQEANDSPICETVEGIVSQMIEEGGAL